MTATSSPEKKSDITVYGATSFVAKHVLRYLLEVASTIEAVEKHGLRITLGGRNNAKLEQLRANLQVPKDLVSVDIFVAEGSDASRLEEMAQSTSVVINCAGPYSKYSSGVVAACAKVGTDYVDITGEFYWVARMREAYGSLAAASGARIISLCGYDSIPTDLTVFAAVQALRESLSKKGSNSTDIEINDITAWHECFGMPNGGTVHTALDFEFDLVRDFFHSQTSKTPNGEGENSIYSMFSRLRTCPFFGGDPLQLTTPKEAYRNPKFDSLKSFLALGEWKNAFPAIHSNFAYGLSIMMPMAPINMKVLQASSLALNYGSKIHIRERYLPLGFWGTRMLGVLGILPILGLQIAIWCALAILGLPGVGKALCNVLIPPGKGAPDWMVEMGSNSVYVVATRATGEDDKQSNETLVDRGYARLDFKGDAGNAVTAQCVCEAALALIFNRDTLPPKSSDGFGTPAELLGDALLSRFQKTPIRPIKVRTLVRQKTAVQEHQVYL